MSGSSLHLSGTRKSSPGECLLVRLWHIFGFSRLLVVYVQRLPPSPVHLLSAGGHYSSRTICICQHKEGHKETCILHGFEVHVVVASRPPTVRPLSSFIIIFVIHAVRSIHNNNNSKSKMTLSRPRPMTPPYPEKALLNVRTTVRRDQEGN